MKKRNIIIAVVAVVVVLFIIFKLFSGGGNAMQSVAVVRGHIEQKVLVSGKVEAVQKVDLAFETGGTVKQIFHQEGDKVKAGDLIASLNTAELEVQLARQQAGLEQAQLALNNLIDPSKKDQLSAQNEVATNEQALKQANDDGASAMNEALVDLPTILNKVKDLATAGSGYLSDGNVRFVGARAQSYKTQAEASYWVAQKSYDQVKKNPDLNGVYTTTKLTATALKDIYALVAYLESESNSSDTADITVDKATLGTYTNDINARLLALLGAINNIEKTTRDVAESEAKLSELLAGVTGRDAATQQLKVRQAELDVQDTQVQIAKQQIRAPFDGVVARNDLELGQTVAASEALISLISENQYQIVSKVPEAEITKISVGNPAKITFDAYPPEELQLNATVSAVDPAEVLVDGVATYKVTFGLLTQDSKVRSGMTASVEIIGATRDNVLLVPARAVMTKNGSYSVLVLQGKTNIEQPVTIGLRGSDGNVEILSGLNEGDSVAVGVAQ